jgi:tetratricopeptide (TPR) repeat protein
VVYKSNAANYTKALEYFDKALEIDPDYVDARVNKGFALYTLKQYKEAIECIDQALQFDPNNANAWYNKGLVLYNLGKAQANKEHT